MRILEKTQTNKNLLVSYESELTKVSKRFSNPKSREIEIGLSSEELKNEAEQAGYTDGVRFLNYE